MRFLERIEKECRESVERGLHYARLFLPRVDGIYGSGARSICTPKPGEVDLNVYSSGEMAKVLVRGPGLHLVSLQVPFDLDPLTEYPQPQREKVFLPIGAVLAWHARPVTEDGERLIRDIVNRLSEEERRLIARAALWKAYDFALRASRGKDLVRALCDLAPYALNWLKRPNDVPSLRQKSIRDVMPDDELLSLCEQALKLKMEGGDVEKLRSAALKYLESIGAHEYREDFETLRKTMKPWTIKWSEPVIVNDARHHHQ